MKHNKYLTLFFALLIAATTILSAQEKKIIKKEGGGTWVNEEGDIFDVPELAVFITQEGDDLVITNVMEENARPKGYEDIDVQLNDVILMANGKRMKTIRDLQNLYKEAKPGTTIKLGMKRGEDMLLASFDKADPEKLPKRKMIVKTMDGGEMDMMGIPQVGLLIGSKGKEVFISEVFDDIEEKLPDADVKKGDVITKLNGKEISSFKDFSKAYGKLDVGEKVVLATLRSGKTYTITFKKPKEEGGMKVIRKTIGD
ncbi:MAG: PDZ domain-containing protein [Ignavibacteriae bacterium]|nr:PDZ domain-containing protein [Ignavibacteriota bacterium]